MLKNLLGTFTSLEGYVQVSIIAACCFILFLCRKQLPFYVSSLFGIITGKKPLKDIRKPLPENKAEVVIRYLDRIFVESKVIYEVPDSFPHKDPDKVAKSINDLVEKHRGKGVMLVLVFARIEVIPGRMLDTLKKTFEKIIENNRIAIWVIFPKNLYGNMEELYKYIAELNRLENKCSVMVKMDNRTETRKHSLDETEKI